MLMQKKREVEAVLTSLKGFNFQVGAAVINSYFEVKCQAVHVVWKSWRSEECE